MEPKAVPDRADYDDVREFLHAWETHWDQTPPSGPAILRRAARLANDAAAAVDLQLGRIRAEVDSADPDAFWTALIDAEFLVASLWKTRLAGRLAQWVQGEDWAGLREFDQALPDLKRMRDVTQHVDEYGRDAESRRHDHPRTGQRVGRRSLHSQMSIGRESFCWLGGTIDFAQARDAAFALLAAIRAVRADTHSGQG